ncbi:SUN domain-containing ossification factor isoform X2 [Sphaeramia orbicularis]|uniref:SUN domain-containing ossification factor isoform X2 n=1 Tax=Sphaeramia orbicularis TaxID=375764 RepID=UPI00117E1AA4|nr:SUN domain-containing ossification factor-like isoform X2 [Sphaeramia orbicularis]
MKMTTRLWRVVSLWLCVAAVCWYPSCYVGCSEEHKEAQRPEPPQDIISEEEPRESVHQRKVEQSLVLATQSFSENEHFQEEDQQKEDQATSEDVDKKEQYLEVVEVEEPAAEVEVEADEGIQLEQESQQSSEYQPSETSSGQDLESASIPPSPDTVSGFADEPEHESSLLNLQDNIPNSFSDEASDKAEVIDSDLHPANCEEEETNPYDSESPPVVLENTSNVHTAGTKTHTDPAQSSQYLEANASHVAKEQDLSSPGASDTDSSASSKDPEDIPTFDEWKRKMMEVEKEKTQSTHTSTNSVSHTVKKVQKNFNNYASVECGAKILGANPEAKSTSAILKENMDLYMLNPCSNKIWFIIELCEPVQVKQLDIANFELFSSTPKDFLVSISDRYPTNKWLKLGTFHARDERTVQSFPLDEHIYAKYVKMFTKYLKVELVSHFGSEHFCPLSLIRVFGTSMVEEYEEIADPSERPEDQDDDLDYPPGYAPGEDKYSKNLIGSAKDAIMNMVNNIAVNVLGGGPEMQGNISSQEVNMTEPTSQPEPTTEIPTTTTDLTSVSHLEEILPSSDDSATEPPTSDTPVPDTPTTDSIDEELPPVEDKIVIPLEPDEEEPISSTITLLDKEEEVDEEKERQYHEERQQETQYYCALLPSFSSTWSCAASLQEYLLQQCSVLMSKKRKCQILQRNNQMEKEILTPGFLLPLPPSACPEPEQHHTEVYQPREQQQAAEPEPETRASPSEGPQPPEETVESHKESEHPLLEPSQTSNLPLPSATDSSSAKPIPIVETPQLITEEPGKKLKPEMSQDVEGEEKDVELSVSVSASSYAKPTVSATVDDTSAVQSEEKIDASQPEAKTPIQTPDMTDQPQVLPPPTSVHVDHHPDPPEVPDPPTEPSHPVLDTVPEPEPSDSPPLIIETKIEDLAEDIASSSGANGQLPRPSSVAPSSTSVSLSDIYAEPPNGTEQNGNPVHGSSQKESVFMRLNNRIKALEMNMSLSGRYLEQLSQRYRKQMEEMQKAFNKTIIKLQNTSRIAEEQDQRQTESIQLLQNQLENVTQLVLNLSVKVSQLQNEVSDRQAYLLLSLGLCLCLGLLLYVRRRSISTPPTTDPEPPETKTYTYRCPERQFSYDEAGLKRSASYPLIHSESLQLDTSEGPEMLQTTASQSLCPANRKKRRKKVKSMEEVETLKPSFHAGPELRNGAAVCNGVPVLTHPTPLTKRLLQPTFRDSPSEGSSEGSHSDDPSFCGITTACSRICDGLPPPKTRAEKRALRRRRPKPSSGVVDLLQAPSRDKSNLSPIFTVQDMVKRKMEQSSGTFGVNVSLSGPV